MNTGAPGILQNEINISFTAKTNVLSNISSILTCDWGYALTPINLDGDGDLLSTFGQPTKFNYNEWYQIWNAMQYVDNVTTVRAIDTLKEVKNQGLIFDVTDSDVVTTEELKLADMYNKEVAELALDNLVLGASTVNAGSTQTLAFFQKYVSSMRNIGIAVCSDETAWESAISTDAGLTGLFSSYFEFAPDFENDQFAVLIFWQNEDNTYTLLEKYTLSYKSDGRNAYGKSIYAPTILNESSKYIYCDINEAWTNKISTDSTSTLDMIVGKDVSSIEVWELSTDYIVDDEVASEGFILKCTTPGTSDATAPDLSESAVGDTEADGTVSWLIIYDTIDSIYPIKLVDEKGVYDGFTFTQGDIQEGYDVLEDPEEVYTNIIMGHEKDINEAPTLASTRKDAVAIVGPYDYTQMVGKSRTEANTYLIEKFGTTDASEPILTTHNTYTCVYGNMKYQYDKYSNKNRWVSLFGDIAGLIALNDATNDPWVAVAGTIRGTIKNAIKLAFQPKKTQMANLYNNAINPVISVAGEGKAAVVYGHKMSVSTASAFDRLNIRKLLLYVERVTANSLRPFEFDINDSFSRDRILGLLNPFYSGVQANRGVYEFRVVCDSTNNTNEIIDANELVVDIYLKPTKTSDFICINQIVTKTGVDFNEIITTG